MTQDDIDRLPPASERYRQEMEKYERRVRIGLFVAGALAGLLVALWIFSASL